MKTSFCRVKINDEKGEEVEQGNPRETKKLGSGGETRVVRITKPAYIKMCLYCKLISMIAPTLM